MALIKCPECGKEISSYAPACIYCGFPLELIGKVPTESSLVAEEEGPFALKLRDAGPAKVKCIKVVRDCTSLNLKDAKSIVDNAPAIICTNFDKEALNYWRAEFEAEESITEIISISDSDMDKYPPLMPMPDATSTRKQSNKANMPKCPTCGSTNVQQISVAGRVVSTAALGLASKKINKTFKCNNCGYTW